MSKVKVATTTTVQTTKVFTMTEEQVKEACVHWIQNQQKCAFSNMPDVEFDVSSQGLFREANITYTTQRVEP